MQNLTVFENPAFGTVRTVEVEGEPWLVGKDVAAALGYANPRKALDDHVDPEDKMQGDGVTIRDSIGREQHPTIINESSLYSLVPSDASCGKLPLDKPCPAYFAYFSWFFTPPMFCLKRPQTGRPCSLQKPCRPCRTGRDFPFARPVCPCGVDNCARM